MRPASTDLERWAATGLTRLAGLDGDRAANRNGVGFNKTDTDIGCSIAEQIQRRGKLTDKQWVVALRLAHRYHRQIGEPPAQGTGWAVEDGKIVKKAPQDAPDTPKRLPGRSQEAPETVAPHSDPPETPQRDPGEPGGRYVDGVWTVTPASQPPTAFPAIRLSPDQQAAHDAIIDWYRSKRNLLITLGGLAGTGKTTITAAIIATLQKEDPGVGIAVVAFTGKAAAVQRSKLSRAGVNVSYCGTIHGMIYKPKTDLLTGRLIGWERAPFLDEDLIIIDEASMVDETLLRDLQGYGKPILAIGDHGQLPPIGGSLNLMANPELKLEKIHRQAEGNPIIRASMIVREEGRLPLCDWDGIVRKITNPDIIDVLPNIEETLVICGTNRLRTQLNQRVRRRLGRKSLIPEPGEKVICLKNNKNAGIYNGLTGILKTIRPHRLHWFEATVAMDGAALPYNGTISRHQFGAEKTLKGDEVPGLHPKAYGDLYDWGYAMTCHKAQGSEAAQVLVYEDCEWMREEDMRRRWKYTAFSRAKERLVVVGR